MIFPLITLAVMVVTQPIEADIQALTRDHVNVALSAWGYSHATASSLYGPTYGPERALDGKWARREDNKWNSAQGKGPHWILIDLGHRFTFDSIVVRHEGVFADGEIYNTSDFELQQADSEKGPWRDIVPPVTSNHDNVSLLKFAKTQSRFVRFITTKGDQHGNAFARIFEIEVYAPKASIDVPLINLNPPSTPTFRHVNGKLESAIQVQTLTIAKVDRFQVNGKNTTVKDGLIWIPVNGDKPSKITCIQKNGLNPTWTFTDNRSWILGLNGGSIDILSSSHQDVAWMDTPDACRDARVQYILEPAIDLMNRESNYRFTMENMLNLMELLQERPERRDQIAKLLKNGQLEFGGTYNQPYEGLLGGEQLVRQVYFGRRWLRKQFPGADTCVAYSVDIPGRSLQMQQILAKAGIRYFVTSRYHEGLFNWGSPDGSSILVYSLPHYGFHNALLKSNPKTAVKEIPQAIQTEIRDFAKYQIPPHYMLLNSGDMEGPLSFGALINEWSKLSTIATLDGKPIAKPTLDYSSTAGLFKSLDVPSAKPFKVSGERPNMWLYIHGPTHHEAIDAQRAAARLLPVAETFATMRCLVEGSFASYPTEKLSKGWLDSLYPDHGIGGYNGHITDGVFQAKFVSARDTARSSVEQSLKAIAGHVKVDRSKGTPVVVFNPHPWVQSDVVNVAAPESWGLWNVIDDEGKAVVSQADRTVQRQNVALASQGATILSSTGKNADRLISSDWWDARKGCWESTAKGKEASQVVIDFSQTQKVDRLLIRHYGAWGEFEKEEKLNTRLFKVFTKVGLDDRWSELPNTTGLNKDPISVIEFKPTAMRYVKVEVLNPNRVDDYTARLINIEAEALIEPKTPTIRFQASNVPSLGYRTFYLVSSSQHEDEAIAPPSSVIENNFYRIRLTQAGIESIVDKQANREILRKAKMAAGEVFTVKSEGNGAGEFGAVQPVAMDGFDRDGAHRETWKLNAELSGRLQTVYELNTTVGGTKVQKRLTVYNQTKKIDFDIDVLGWNGAKYREFRVAFPLGGPKAKVSYEVPMGTVNIGKDEIKTTGGVAYGGLDYWQKCSDIHPREVQDFINVTDGSLTTTVSSSVAVFDHIDPTKLGGNGPLIQPVLLASRRSCHGAGNWYTQPGDHHYHFSLTSSSQPIKGECEAAVTQLPLIPVFVGDSDERLPSTLSFASIDSSKVRISTIKKAEDDNSIVMRFYNRTGALTSIRVDIFGGIRKSIQCNLIEDELKELPMVGGKLRYSVGPYSIETLKLQQK
jgi:alpha-mannosidase